MAARRLVPSLNSAKIGFVQPPPSVRLESYLSASERPNEESDTCKALRRGSEVAKPMKAESCTPGAIIARVGRCPLHVPRRDLITARRHDFPL